MGSEMSTMGPWTQELCTRALVLASICLTHTHAQGRISPVERYNQFVNFGGARNSPQPLFENNRNSPEPVEESREGRALVGPGGHALHAHVAVPQDLGHGGDDYSHDSGHEQYIEAGVGVSHHDGGSLGGGAGLTEHETVGHDQHCSYVQEEQCTQLVEQHCTQTNRQTCLDIPMSSCEAHTVEECMEIPEQICETKTEPMCVETYAHECTVEHDTVVETHCETVPGEKCFHFDEQICKQVPDKVCTTVTDVVCEEIEEEYCETYFDVSIGKECLDFNEAVCETTSTKI